MRDPARILVVDDEPLNLEIIAEHLADAGYRLQLFESAKAAWEHLQTAEGADYRLILLDRMMPGMDGMQFLRMLKADARFRNTRVIMQTAACSPEQVREGVAAGAYYYLYKPYSGRQLLAIVQAALSEPTDPDHAAASDDTGLSFEFSTLREARQLATRLGARCPDPELAAMGLGELFINAIEHGNLDISYAEKAALRLANNWEAEIERRLQLPEYAQRKVKVDIRDCGAALVFTITDCGKGFDWQRYLAIDPERAYDPNGRGIAVARLLSFAGLEYQGCGNVAVATVSIPPAKGPSA